MSSDICPLCGCDQARVEEVLTPDRQRTRYLQFFCPACGHFDITNAALDEVLLKGREWKKLRVAHLLAERFIKNIYTATNVENRENELLQNSVSRSNRILIYNDNESPLDGYDNLQVKLEDLLKTYPRNIMEKAQRALQNIGRILSAHGCAYIHVDSSDPCFFATEHCNVSEIRSLLSDADWLIEPPPGSRGYGGITLSAKGWQKFEELERNWQNSNTVFVAMWFNKRTNAYKETVKEAIKAAGYDEPVFIDTYPHNNFIMDEVINKINEARFVIADFTCIPEQPEKNGKIPGGVRGGVYFEAGYARGLGKEVIVTCCNSDDAKKRRHFDIDQLNTLFWHKSRGKLYDDNKIDFAKRLAERIKATVGKGKLY